MLVTLLSLLAYFTLIFNASANAEVFDTDEISCRLNVNQFWLEGSLSYTARIKMDLINDPAKKDLYSFDSEWTLAEDIDLSSSPNINNFKIELNRLDTNEGVVIAITFHVVKFDLKQNIRATTRILPIANSNLPQKFYIDLVFGPQRYVTGARQSSMDDFDQGYLADRDDPGLVLAGECFRIAK